MDLDSDVTEQESTAAKPWKDANWDDRLERTRQHVKQLEQIVERQERLIAKLITHRHNKDTGEPIEQEQKLINQGVEIPYIYPRVTNFTGLSDVESSNKDNEYF